MLEPNRKSQYSKLARELKDAHFKAYPDWKWHSDYRRKISPSFELAENSATVPSAHSEEVHVTYRRNI